MWWLLWKFGKWVEPRTPKLRAKAEEIVRECSSEEMRQLAAALHQQTQSGVLQWEWSGWFYAHPSFGGVISGTVRKYKVAVGSTIFEITENGSCELKIRNGDSQHMTLYDVPLAVDGIRLTGFRPLENLWNVVIAEEQKRKRISHEAFRDGKAQRLRDLAAEVVAA